MKTGRELLELAAKAAGYQIDQRASFYTWKEHRRLALLNPSGGHTLWNSEEDDGDALRLAVKLRLDVATCNGTSYADGTESVFPNIGEPQNGDAYAATRLAITRAGAAIGEAMP